MSKPVIKSASELDTITIKRGRRTYTYWRFFYVLRDGQRKAKLVGRTDKIKRQAAKQAKQDFLNLAVRAPVATTGKIVTLREWLWHFKTNVISDRAETTKLIYSATSRYLVASMGGGTKLTAIGRRQADKFKSDLIGNKLLRANKSSSVQKIGSMATVARHITSASAIFNAAVDAGEMDANPFTGIEVLVPADKGDWHYVEHEEVERLLAVCWSVYWRTYVALCRWGGLRQQEARNLRWVDINLPRGSMKVYGAKISRTKRRAEEVMRDVPINKRLAAVLAEAKLAADGEFVVGSVVTKTGDAVKTMRRMMKRAGLAWESPFHDLRRSRAQDLADAGIPPKDAAAIMGHSVEVMMRFYVRTREATFAKAKAV